MRCFLQLLDFVAQIELQFTSFEVPLTNEEHLKLELEHIMLEIRSRRGRHLRHFVDQYFCYKHGYVRSSGTPNWDGIIFNEYVSKSADEMHLAHGHVEVTRDHIVPLNRIRLELLQLENPCEHSVELLLGRQLQFATITREEDARLNYLGLKQTMPLEYDEKDNPLFQDIFARYRKADIDLLPHRRLETPIQ
tara:strand:+ start:435 stop:1010 length:576 start_codon:yes stop_codon:yes gene_type:complete